MILFLLQRYSCKNTITFPKKKRRPHVFKNKLNFYIKIHCYRVIDNEYYNMYMGHFLANIKICIAKY